VLIGFMGCGKSTLGPRLADRLGVQFLDLDDEIERRAGCRIAELVDAEGEAGLRRHELAALRALVDAAPAGCVVATGGGVVETPPAHALLRALGRIVWLEAEPEASVSRLPPAARAARPLLDAEGTWRRRWEIRQPLYRALAEAIVATHPDAIDASLERLVAVARAERA
jgi:shikimate kinase